MTDQASAIPPQPPTTKPKGRWRWIKIAVSLCIALFLAANLFGMANTLKLELRRVDAYVAGDGKKIEIINVGTTPITITKITVNDRADCLVQTPVQVAISVGRLTSLMAPDPETEKFSVSTFNVGDKIYYHSTCHVIRALVDTDQGKEIYSFQ